MLLQTSGDNMNKSKCCNAKQVTSFVTEHSAYEAVLCTKCGDVEKYVRAPWMTPRGVQRKITELEGEIETKKLYWL